jgi:LysM repeat protein
MKTLKISRLFKPKKMRAATARRSATSAGMDFESIPEPNMKLSRALLIVLLLHVVAVSGIVAFNALKTRENSFVPANPDQTENTPASTGGTAATDKAPGVATQKEIPPQDDPKPSHSPASEEQEKTVSSSGKTYIVKKGDNPVTIAKRLKVSYSDLMSLNNIEHPRKLQIGQKLLIPKTPSPKPDKKKKKK